MSQVFGLAFDGRRMRPSSWFVLLALVWALAHATPARSQSPLPPGLSPPAKPTVMPAFELPTIAGTQVRSEALRGQVVVIRFWASW